MRLSIRHATTYTYDPPVDRCVLRLRLYPPSFESQRVQAWQVSVNGQPMQPLLTTATGDREAVWTCNRPGAEIVVLAEGEIETSEAAGVVRGLRDTIRPQVYLRTTALTEPDARIEALAAGVTGASVLDRLHGLLAAVSGAVAYRTGTTSSATTAAQALKAGEGVCQDHAHVFIAAARQMGIPARYVVGYLHAEDTKLTETHAWGEAFAPEIGWVGFDPANRICPTERYVRLGCGLDSADAAPLRGNVSGIYQERLSASVDIAQMSGQSQDQVQDGQSQNQQ